MRGLYWQALMVAGAFTLLPGRRLPALLFPEHPWAGLAILAVAGAVAALAWLWRRRARRVGFSRGGGISA
jgi:hypothetical protein